MILTSVGFFFFFFNDTATTEIYTLSLHDALPISLYEKRVREEDLPFFLGLLDHLAAKGIPCPVPARDKQGRLFRSEEHTSELQSRQYLVCRLLLENKKLT